MYGDLFGEFVYGYWNKIFELTKKSIGSDDERWYNKNKKLRKEKT